MTGCTKILTSDSFHLSPIEYMMLQLEPGILVAYFFHSLVVDSTINNKAKIIQSSI